MFEQKKGQGFVHLNLHSEYSIVDSTVRIKPLIKRVADDQMSAIAMTDNCNLFAMVKFYRAAISAGVKPIIGADFSIKNEVAPKHLDRIILLCQNAVGYSHLTRLISRCYTQGQHSGQPLLEKEWLVDEGCDGLIAISGARAGEIGRYLLANNLEQANKSIAEWKKLFPDRFYMELIRTGRPQEEAYLHQAVNFAAEHDLPVVATNDVRFLHQGDFESHEARVCIQEGRVLDDPRRPKNYSDQQFLKTSAEMVELFKDIPEAIENTVEIAKRCNLELTLGKSVLPDFPLPPKTTIESFFKSEATAGLEKLAKKYSIDTLASTSSGESYSGRLNRELDVIIDMGFPGYFLIVADFIKWSRGNDVPVGPGRGSGAGSLVAYALGITNIDPMKYELLFERFLNPERVSMPDFDIDFCMDGRDRVIEYVVNNYGQEKVSQIITFGSMAAKAVVRDAGRVLSLPYGFVDQIAKLIPFDLGMTLTKALEQEEALRTRYNKEDDVQTLIDLGLSLEGLIRNAGKHAGGVVIAPSELTDFTPLYCEADNTNVVTQLDKDDVEAVGLVKFDFLGLRTLTIIDWALKTINQQMLGVNEESIDIDIIPLDDEVTFDLLKACQTTAVFQLESRGMKDLIKRLQPDCFEDIIALVALFRPGPLQSGMVDDFIERKHGRTQVRYPHPELEPILKPTYGVILYQEQVMQIAQVLANYTLGAADMLRRAMGKKKPEEMAKQRSIFLEGATARDVDETVAANIFDLMEKFAGYGFNKSHSAAYALLAYQTAWLKAHYPSAFMAAVLSADMDNTDKVVLLMDECRAMKLKVQPPDVNHCAFAFTVNEQDEVLYGLGAVKGAGEAALNNLIEERVNNGLYKDLYNLTQRIDLRKANKRVLEALIRSGSMDSLGKNRSTLLNTLPTALQAAEQFHRNQERGQNDLFGQAGSKKTEFEQHHYEETKDWDEEERLVHEKATLGLYLSGHPITVYEPELTSIITGKIASIRPDSKEKKVTIAGHITAIRTMNSRRGDRIAFVTIDDRSARIDVAVFGDHYPQFRDLLIKDQLVIIEGNASIDEYTDGVKMVAEKIYDMNHARETYAKHLMIAVNAETTTNGFVGRLQTLLQPYCEGRCHVFLNYTAAGASAQLALGQQWRVRPTNELLTRLKEMNGDNNVQLVY